MSLWAAPRVNRSPLKSSEIKFPYLEIGEEEMRTSRSDFPNSATDHLAVNTNFLFLMRGFSIAYQFLSVCDRVQLA